MLVEAQVEVKGTKEAVWRVATDFENWGEIIRGVDKVEILEKPQPEQELIGLKWSETRTMFGQSATEVMWVTESKTNEYYVVQAESCGCLYTSTIRISENEDDSKVCTLSMSHNSEARGFLAKIFAIPMGFLMRGPMQKAFLEDLTDFKTAVEKANND